MFIICKKKIFSQNFHLPLPPYGLINPPLILKFYKKIRGWYPKPLCFKRFYIWSYILQTESFIHTKYIEAFAYQCSGHWPLADAVPFYPG